MPKNKDQNPEANSAMIRIRCTPTFKKAFEEYCEVQNYSEASVGRLGIWTVIRKDHAERTGEKLEEPDINPQSWSGNKR